MRILLLLCGAAVAGVMAAAACGDDTTVLTTSSGPSAGGGGAGGGMGGAGASSSSSTTTSASSSSSGTAVGGSGGGNTCEQACDKIENTCGFAGACAQLMIDCSDPAAECPSQCIVDPSTDCADIASLASQNPDPMLGACLQACQGGTGGGGGAGGGMPGNCGNCVTMQCAAELQACQGDQNCQQFVMCAQNCADMMCANGCLQMFPGQESQDVLACACGSCMADCAQCN
jgi:hypothetical protein